MQLRARFTGICLLATVALGGNVAPAGAQSPVTISFPVAAPADDVNEDGSTYAPFMPTMWVGTAGTPAASLTGLRFASVAIPRGSIVQSAHVEVFSTQSQWVTLSMSIGVEASGNAPVFSAANPPSARSLLPSQVAHQSNLQWAAGAWYSLDEIGALVQAVVNRSDWRGGNNLAVVVRGTKPTSWGRKFARSFDGDPLQAPRLVVTYIPGPDEPPPPPPTATGFQNQEYLVGLANPTSIAFAPDGRMLVTEDEGRVRVALPGHTTVEPAPFLSLTNIESTVGERALIGLALDPDFLTNGYYYVFYTAKTPLRDRVSRFTAVNNVTTLASEVVLWQDTMDSSDIHHGGGLLVGTDGKLYISTGDGQDVNPSASHTSQLLTTARGKVLRINRDGTIPNDNPYVDGAGPNVDAIWARGFRNPFRMSVDPATATVHVYDVGGGAWEEVNVLARGANFGWPICEGACGTSGMTNPLFAYAHNGLDSAIGGGVVYRGTSFPPEYVGNLFYGDYVQKWVRRLVPSGSGGIAQDLPFVPPDGTKFGPHGNVVDVEVGSDGSLYYADIIGGTVHRVTYFAGNNPPVVTSASATPLQGQAPLSVSFSGAASDADGDSLSYTWEFGDGAFASGTTAQHAYVAPGVYFARVVVSDGPATSYSPTLTIRVGAPPTASITSPATNATFRGGEVITYRGTASDSNETLGADAFSWSVVFHHDTHIHPAQGPLAGITEGTFVIPATGHDFSGNVYYEIILTVTNSQGLSDTDSVAIYPQKVNLTIRSNPPSLAVSLDQTTQSAPIVKDTLVNFQHRLTAATQQTAGGKTYQFVSWSDGGAAIHDIVVPSTDTTYTATYQEVVATGPVTATFPVLAGGDDVNEVAGALQATAPSVWLGTGGSATASYTGLRFSGVTIPRGSVIQSASLDVSASTTAWIALQFELGAQSTPAAPFASGALPSSRVLSAPRVAHNSNVSWTSGNWYRFDGLAPLVQSVVDGGTWSSGNALAIVAHGTGGGAWGRKFAAAFETAAARAPRLVVTYIPGSEGPPPPPPPPPTARIDGTVFVDADKDGVRDPGEAGFAGAAITLSGTATGTTQSDPAGAFAFTSLATGSYVVTMAEPAGYLFTTPASAAVSLGTAASAAFGVAPRPPDVTTTISSTVGLTSDDVNEVNGQLAVSSALWVGNGGATDTSYLGLRFTTIAVPRGATIVSARLELTAAATAWIQIACEIAAEDADAATTFTVAAKPSQRLLTAARVQHSSNLQWVADGTYPIDGLAPIVHAVTNRNGWQSGNSLVVILRGLGSAWGRKFIKSFESAPAAAARLVVVYR